MNDRIKEYIHQELKKAEQALKAAQNLLADGLYDDAVSRAYYAVFHGARAALKIKGIETVSHKGLISQFALHLVKAGEVEEEYGDILRQIKEDRETGDYEPLVTFGSEEATKLVGSADRFLVKMRDWIGRQEA
ncbi:MAG: HEPN domain-containing protein [Candidatus Omnitrophica bacterium]|nr:HEPN domain-containing protein [Candidatus Omnitrophota bacterium]